jgi:hypothetical protein
MMDGLWRCFVPAIGFSGVIIFVRRTRERTRENNGALEEGEGGGTGESGEVEEERRARADGMATREKERLVPRR